MGFFASFCHGRFSPWSCLPLPFLPAAGAFPTGGASPPHFRPVLRRPEQPFSARTAAKGGEEGTHSCKHVRASIPLRTTPPSPHTGGHGPRKNTVGSRITLNAYHDARWRGGEGAAAYPITRPNRQQLQRRSRKEGAREVSRHHLSAPLPHSLPLPPLPLSLPLPLPSAYI